MCDNAFELFTSFRRACLSSFVMRSHIRQGRGRRLGNACVFAIATQGQDRQSWKILAYLWILGHDWFKMYVIGDLYYDAHLLIRIFLVLKSKTYHCMNYLHLEHQISI